MTLLDKLDLMVPLQVCTEALREEINSLLADALIRQSEATINRMDNIVIKTVRAALAGEPLQCTGPALNGHVGEHVFYSRPFQPIQIEVQGDNVAKFVMYPLRGGVPIEPQIYSTAPLVIPQGYFCQLRYRQLAEGEVPPQQYSNIVRVPSRQVVPNQEPLPQFHGGTVGQLTRNQPRSTDLEMMEW